MRLKRLFCSIITASMMMQYCMPVFAEDVEPTEEIETVESEENEDTSTDQQEEFVEEEEEESIEVQNATTAIYYITYTLEDGVLYITDTGIGIDILKLTQEEKNSVETLRIGKDVTDAVLPSLNIFPNLESIIVDSENTLYDSRNNCNAIIETSTNTLRRGCKNTVIPDSVTAISNIAFQNLSNLTTITIPKSVTSIGPYAFSCCSNLSTVNYLGSQSEWNAITIEEGNSYLTSANINYLDTQNTCGENLYWTYDNGVLTIIGTGSMDDYNASTVAPWNTYKDSITNVVMQEGITHIGTYAFYNYTNLTNVDLPKSVTTIGAYAFDGCSNLNNINYTGQMSDWNSLTTGNSVGNGNSKFLNTPITYVNPDYKCGENVTWSYKDDVLTISGTGDMEDFYGCDTSTIWYQYRKTCKSVVIQDGVTSIGYANFTAFSALTSISIPESVTKIGSNAFNGCSSLTSITLPKKLKTIESGTFGGCKSLTDIEIPDGVTSIASLAFASCFALKEIEIPDSVTTIENGAFSWCKNLESIKLSKNITSIPFSTFSYCYKLNNVVIPSGVKSIGSYALSDCSSLTNITIPKSVTTISDYAFNSSSALKNVTYTGSQEEWDAITIGTYNDPLTSATITCTGEDDTELETDLKGEQLKGYSLSLSGDIGVNFYMSLEEDTLNTNGLQMAFTYNGNTEYADLDTSKTAQVDGNTYYIFTCHVSAKDMATPITAQLVAGDLTGDIYTYSVQEYADYIIENASTKGFIQGQVNIAKAMLTYGAYAQEYFGYNVENKPTEYINDLVSYNLSNEKYTKNDQSDSITFVGARLVLTSTPGLKLYFNKDANIQCADASDISIEGKYKVVTISNTMNIYKKYTVTGENFELNYSMASYGNIALNGSNESLKNLINAMFAYYSYFNKY